MSTGVIFILGKGVSPILASGVKSTWPQGSSEPGFSNVDDDSAPIPPMIFLTFVENAFKYGASANHDCTILLRLRLADGHLAFETENRIMKHPDEFRENMPVGLNNCRNRLEGLFPGRYTLGITETDGTFRVNLQINLNSNERRD